MDSRMRLTFACGTCLGMAIGFSAGHFSLWNRVPRPVALPTYEAPSMGSGGFDLPAVVAVTPDVPATTPSPGGAVVLNDPDLGDEPVHAEALVEVPGVAAPPALNVGSAKPLAQISSSVQQAQQSEQSTSEPLHPDVVKMLADELQEATEQQREVWSDALRGMTPEDAAGIILMWKKFGQAGSGELHSSSPPPLFSASHPDPVPLHTRHSLKELLSTAPETGPASPIRRAEEHNLANLNTCGYLNLIPIQQELSLEAGSAHQEFTGYRLDLKRTHPVPTGNPSHVMICNQGFLGVQLSTGEVQYTRIGRLVLDADRRLCVDLGGRDLPISPEVKLPEGAYGITIVENQIRALVAGQSDPADLPALRMARFFDASRLKPLGGGLYAPTTASGAAQLVPAELIQGALEYPEAESAEEDR